MKLLLLITVCLACVLAVKAHADHPDDVYWEALSPPECEFNGFVEAVAVYDNKLIAGGYFTEVGTLTVNHVASWDGGSWSPLGSGMDGDVTSLTVYDGQLIAGGSFGTAGGTQAVNIAAWDGSSWSALGSANIGGIKAMTVYDGKLAVCRHSPVYGVSLWDGSTWSFIPSSFEPLLSVLDLSDLIGYDNQLILGGTYQMGIVDPIYCIAAWDGTSWSRLGSWPGAYTLWVFALEVYEGQLVAGGGFGMLRSWDGSTWSSNWPGLGEDDSAFDFAVYHDELIVGGNFITTPGVPGNNIAAWNGFSWEPLGSGLNGSVQALTVFDDILIAAGRFTTAGNKASAYIAAWNKLLATAIMITSFEARPTNNGIALAWSLTTDEELNAFRIYRSQEKAATEHVLVARITDASKRDFVDETARPGVRYIYSLVVEGEESGEVRLLSVTAERAPLTVQLFQNHPNPFNPATSIRYSVPHASHVILNVYSPSGRLVRTLVNRKQSAGVHEVSWDGTNNAGDLVASGIYLCRLHVGKVTQSKKMTLLK